MFVASGEGKLLVVDRSQRLKLVGSNFKVIFLSDLVLRLHSNRRVTTTTLQSNRWWLPLGIFFFYSFRGEYHNFNSFHYILDFVILI